MLPRTGLVPRDIKDRSSGSLRRGGSVALRLTGQVFRRLWQAALKRFSGEQFHPRSGDLPGGHGSRAPGSDRAR